LQSRPLIRKTQPYSKKIVHREVWGEPSLGAGQQAKGDAQQLKGDAKNVIKEA
jgi:hypothetical protein